MSSKSVFKSLVSLVVIICLSFGGFDLDSLSDWTACIDSVDITLDFHNGFLAPPRKLQYILIVVDLLGKIVGRDFNLVVLGFWKEPIWGIWTVREVIIIQ